MNDRDESSGEGSPLALRHIDLEVRSAQSVKAEPARPVVVVLGMHRSGTSLLSNVLHVLGVDMADATDHISPKNAGGFWERPDLVAIHDEILAAIDRPIARPSHILPFPPAWWRSKEVQALKPKLIAYVREQLARSSNPWGFKDPRTCRLLPLWWEVFRELNLEPVYVTAMRTPAESSMSMSQKSSARRLSVANSELMWLTYNYDIARYVTVKSPAVMVDYEEWFADPIAVAGRLTDKLGIGHDLAPEDISECMASIVRGEYRHQFDGKEGVTSGLPIATMLYKVMTANQPLGSSDVRALRGQLRLVDLFFKSMGPVAFDMDGAALARTNLEAERDELVRAKAEAERALFEKETAAQQLLSEKESAAAELRQAVAERDELVRAKAEAERALSEKETAAQQLLSEKESAAGELRQILAERDELVQAKAEAERVLFEKETAAQQLLSEKESAAAQLRQAVAERDELEEARKIAADLALAADEAARVAREDTQLARQEAESAKSLAAAQAELAKTRLRQQGQRTRDLLHRAKDWRDRYRAEHGEPSARLDSASHAAEMRRSIMTLERRLAATEERNSRYAAELEARARTLASIGLNGSKPPLPDTDEAVFLWPGAEDGIEVDGGIDRVDSVGILGHVSFANRPDVVPVVEVRVNGSLIHAQSCLANDEAARSKADRWPFFIPWQRLGQESAGGEAVILVAGLERELGRAAIPADLCAYHLSPAVRAAKSIGGTVAEAAEYHRWLLEHESPDQVDLARTYRSAKNQAWPTITVLVYSSDRDDLILTVESLRTQTYAEWQAICIDGRRDIADLDPRVSTVASTHLDELLGDFSDEALFSFVEAGDIISPTALLHLASAALKNTDFALIYSDEDWIDPVSGLRAVPYMKGEWSPALALAQDYVSRLALVRRDKLVSSSPRDATGVFDLALKAAMSGQGPVIHVPFVLYHRSAEHRSPELSGVVQSVLDSSPAFAGAKVIKNAGGRLKVAWPLPDQLPCVSLIVPTRDRVDLLRVCVDGFLHETRYANLEVLIADNDSQEEQTKTYLAKVSTHPRVRVIPCPGPFNFSRINNLAARQASGSLIGLMNNDLKVLDPDWLREMVAHVVRPDIGIVGAKLFHGDGTIQHAGVTLGIGIASHLYKSSPGGAEGHQGRLVLPQDLSAVTAACLLIRRDVWEEVGGLDEEFPVAYNDVDLCLKVRAAGYRVVWTPDALVYHLESQSRGKEDTPEKRERLNLDKSRLLERWGDQLSFDPFHSPNLSNRHVDARLAFPSRARAPWNSAAALQQ